MLRWEINTQKDAAPLAATVDDDTRPALNPDTLELTDARRAFHEGRADESVGIYQAILKRDPGNYAAAGELGNVLMVLRQWDKATDAYARTAEILFQRDDWPATLAMVHIIGKVAPKRAIELSNDFAQRLKARHDAIMEATK